MDVVSDCPLQVGSVLWQRGEGAFILTVICKATYTLLPDESSLSLEQDTPVELDEYWDDDERRSLHAASDFVPFKRRVDVLLVGCAFAPRGRPVRSLRVRLAVGDIDKSIEVFCDRAFTPDGQLLEGAHFTRMPLTWERAAGGPETSNPAGVRADVTNTHGMIALPNLQPAGLQGTSLGSVIPPIGYGPIAPSWPDRKAKIHAGLAGWDPRRWSHTPLRPDLDPAFFNAAPADQQLDALRPNERIVLENLHPEFPHLSTTLVTATPRVLVEWQPGGAYPLEVSCDTLCIDTDRATCSLTWRGQIPLDDPHRKGRVTVTLSRLVTGGTSEVAAQSGRPVLPFQAPEALGSTALAGAALPSAPEPSPSKHAPSMEETVTEGVADLFDARHHALPFVRAAVPEAPGNIVHESPAPVAAPSPEPPPLEPPPPPPMIGPLATPEMQLPSAPVSTAQPEPLPEAERAAPPALVETAPQDPGLPLDAYPIDRCARIAASIARTRAEAPRILEEQRLSPALWEALDRHWADMIRGETGRGRSTLLRAYDAAYIAQLEEERGPIRVEDYARLLVAAERGGADRELAAMGLPKGALLRLQRVWLGKVAGDTELGKSVRIAVESAREA